MTKLEIEEMSSIVAIKTFFGDGEDKVTISEFKALTKADRDELGALARQALIEQLEN